MLEPIGQGQSSQEVPQVVSQNEQQKAYLVAHESMAGEPSPFFGGPALYVTDHVPAPGLQPQSPVETHS